MAEIKIPLSITATGLEELKKLLILAEAQVEQLSDTLEKISNSKIQVDVQHTQN